ncbi:hypothetical protein KIN20_036783 [Parelaphostrongylus tenuis]|uniref:Uncharacterized protein n=1 Tax=Parelaphostrongylus tenuis TaxID=148309 RepID=A0AAD5RDH9_PARTN|nr:hypothetical protein KIN20_036783 [Parelaphostrongylus tenuis]
MPRSGRPSVLDENHLQLALVAEFLSSTRDLNEEPEFCSAPVSTRGSKAEFLFNGPPTQLMIGLILKVE